MKILAGLIGAAVIAAIAFYGTLVPIGFRVLGTTVDCGPPITAIAMEPDLEYGYPSSSSSTAGTVAESCQALGARRLFLSGVAALIALGITIIAVVVIPKPAAARPAIAPQGAPPPGPPPVPGAQWDGHRWWWWDGTAWRS